MSKKIVKAVLLVSILVIGSLLNLSVASASVELVEAQTIRIEISELFRKYGVTYEFTEKSEASYPRSEVNSTLKSLEASIASITERKPIVAPSDSIADIGDPVVGTYSNMIHEHTYTSFANVSNTPTGNAIIEISCIGTIKNSYDYTIGMIINRV